MTNPPAATVEAVADTLRAAYMQGALDVHNHYQPDPDPSFGEAASDYVASVDVASLTTQVVEQQNIRKALNTLIMTVNAADELIVRAYGTGNPEVWKDRMAKCGEARAFLSTVKGEWL